MALLAVDFKRRMALMDKQVESSVRSMKKALVIAGIIGLLACILIVIRNSSSAKSNRWP